MRREMMEVLACPVCKGQLELVVEQEEDEEVVTGRLICHVCNETYPIEDSIPNLLSPHLRS